MNQKEINDKAYKIYAALGELYLKIKQHKQIILNLKSQTSQLESQIVELSKLTTAPQQQSKQQES